MSSRVPRLAILPVGALLVAQAHGATPVPAPPKVRVDTVRQDFGSVKRGAVVRKSFVISKAGAAPLIIRSASFSTPGMSMKVAQNIEPGGSAELELIWDTRGYSRDVEGGVSLELNDPRVPRLVLTLMGKVLSPIDIIPAPAFYLSQFQGESESQSIVIQNNEERELEIIRLEYDNSLFSLEAQPLDSGKTFRLTATVSPDAPLGRHQEAVLVHTDSPIRPRLRIEVNVLVKPAVFVSEPAIDFGRVRIAALQRDPARLEYLTQTVVVSRREGDMRILSVDSDIPFLKVNVTPNEPAQRFRVDMSLDPDSMVAGSFDGHLLLRTDDESFPEIRVAVRVAAVR